LTPSAADQTYNEISISSKPIISKMLMLSYEWMEWIPRNRREFKALYLYAGLKLRTCKRRGTKGATSLLSRSLEWLRSLLRKKAVVEDDEGSTQASEELSDSCEEDACEENKAKPAPEGDNCSPE
jgi:hypothetical protein